LHLSSRAKREIRDQRSRSKLNEFITDLEELAKDSRTSRELEREEDLEKDTKTIKPPAVIMNEK